MPIRLHMPDGSSRSLRWTDHHAASSHGGGVLLFKHSSEILDGAAFRVLRDHGAWLDTDREDRVRSALGFASDEDLGSPPPSPAP